MLSVVTDINPFRLSQTPAFVTINTNKQAEPNIRIDCSAIDASGTPVAIGTDSQTPNASGNATFELSEYFNSILKPAFQMPGSGFMRINQSLSAKFVLWVNEVYGTPPDSQSTLIHTREYFATKGKIPPALRNIFYSTFTSWENKIDAPDLRLSLEHLQAVADKRTPERIISKSEPLKFYILADRSLPNISFTETFLFTDGSTGTRNSGTWVITPAKGQVVEFDLGYNHLGTDAWLTTNHPTKTLASYTIKIESPASSEPLMPIHRFVVDNRQHRQQRVFAFLNSVGAYDTFRATGEANTELEYDFTIADTALRPGANVTAKRKVRSSQDISVRCNTGYIKRETMLWLSEMLNSTQVFLIEGSRAIPVVLQTETATHATDAAGLVSLDFEYSIPETISNE